MTRKLATLIGLQAFVIIALSWAMVYFGRDEYDTFSQADEDEVTTPNRVQEVHGAKVVTLSPEAQAQSDIRTERLAAVNHQNTLSALGQVLSIDSLIDLRTRYLNAKANANIYRASLNNSQQDYLRIQSLNKDEKNVSDRALIAAQSLFKADQAKVQAAETEANNILNNMRQMWGNVIASEAIKETPNASMQSLFQRREVLVLVTFPLDYVNENPQNTISISPIGSQTKSMNAGFVALAPQLDSTVQGRTFFYHAPAEVLRSGMRVNVELKDNGKKNGLKQGVVVPTSAIVWYGGKAWVYKKQNKEQFIRLPVSTENPSNSGWFIQHNQLSSGDELVINGAQLLLSEEFKYQIKNENED